MVIVSILHPFTPKAVGLAEKGLHFLHSQPHLKAMAKLSREEGFECSMDYFTENRITYSLSHDIVAYNFHPVDVKWNGDHKKWKKQTSKSCLKEYKKNTPDVTIINMSGHSSPFSHTLAKTILQNQKQYIAMLGGQHYTDTSENREYYKNAHHILVHTNLQKRAMEQMDMFNNLDIRVFPLGVDCDVFRPISRKNSAPVLLYVGRIVEWKRIHLAIEAVSILKENGFPEASLKIIGPVFSQEYLKTLQTLILKKGLETNVSFLGHKEHSELPSYFQEADLFVLPSDKETFGMVMIEAMACGTPVAGIDCPGGPADVITHLENGLLSTPENYSQTILEYFTNKEMVVEIEKNARYKVLNQYSIHATYKVLEESINSALSI